MFEHLRLEQQVREAVTQGAFARVRAGWWMAACIATAVVGTMFAVLSVWAGFEGGALALVAFTVTAPAGVRAYWRWREARRADWLIVDLVSSFAERTVAMRVEAEHRRARDGDSLGYRPRDHARPLGAEEAPETRRAEVDASSGRARRVAGVRRGGADRLADA